MGLSVEKLSKILSELHCVPLCYYEYRDYLRYIECMYLKTKDIFFLFIDDEYKFKTHNSVRAYTLKRIRDNEIHEIMEKYTKEEDKIDIAKIYSGNIAIIDTESKPKVTEEGLEESYNISLDLENQREEAFSIREIKRQTRRLKMIVEGSKYRVCVISNGYVVIPRKEDDVIFQIKDDNSKLRKAYVVVDLETIMTDVKILENIGKIYDGFIEILNKNIVINKTKLEEFKNIDISTNNVYEIVEKINRYSTYIDNFNDIIENKETEEQQIIEKIKNIRNKPKYGITQDLKDAPMLLEMDEKLLKIKSEKNEYIDKIIDLKKKQQNNVLILDKILFDNIVLLSTIRYNLSELKLLK